MDTSQWPQGIVVKTMEEMKIPKNTNTRKIRAQQQQNDEALKNCPSNLDHGLIGSSSISDGGYECHNIIQDLQVCTSTTTSGGILFPFEDLKQVSNTSEQSRDGESSSNGYWDVILGGN
ncbi:uncharacterized protein LOC107028126 isoform X2 [Solanum pennellii]|uniref:Uncharacterized protein LOC107028126 isoform X2 n=1 Tax=Solanum pennellii TaxID=28526 RepID=A0ABM1HF49_SOLPN|nr:uncharacterized protein LOC107028126 isoform X2 [Solanum pennellii]